MLSPDPLSAEQVFHLVRETIVGALDESAERAGSAERGLLAGAIALILERTTAAPRTAEPVQQS